MASFDDLLGAYQRHVRLPWTQNLSPAERTWVLWYEPTLERRVTANVFEFEQAARDAGFGWKSVDVSLLVVSWLAAHRHSARLMRRPNEITALAGDLLSSLNVSISNEAATLSERDILGVFGAGALFGLASVASLIEAVAPNVSGRLLVAFPGRYEAGRYRLLDARDSWNYHATPIPPNSYL